MYTNLRFSNYKIDKINNQYSRFFGFKIIDETPDIYNLVGLIEYIIYEKYRLNKMPLIAKLPFDPQRIPQNIRMFLSKKINQSKIKTNVGFPNFPNDQTVDHLRFAIKNKINGDDPFIPFWPGEFGSSIVLTHDVDSDYLFKNKSVLDEFLRIEEDNGFRSAWYFVTDRFKLDEKVIFDLIERGHEIGFHGDKHDYKLAYLKRKKIVKRLDKCREFLNKFDVKGGRSPVFLRTPLFLEILADYLIYDTSVHDCTFGGLTGENEGCCSCFPFFIGDLLEIPTTIPADYMLKSFGYDKNEILKFQVDKFDSINTIGGCSNVITHPEPAITANDDGMYIYEEFLKKIATFTKVWKALPKEVSSHWKTRDMKIINNLKKSDDF